MSLHASSALSTYNVTDGDIIARYNCSQNKVQNGFFQKLDACGMTIKHRGKKTMIKFRMNRQRTDVKRSMQKQIVWLFASEVHGRKVLLKGDVGGLLLHVDSFSV